MSGTEFLKGMVTGGIVGAAAMMLFDPVTTKQRRKMKRSASHMMQSISDAIDDMVSR